MTLLFTILVTFFAGMGAGLGTGFAGICRVVSVYHILPAGDNRFSHPQRFFRSNGQAGPHIYKQSLSEEQHYIRFRGPGRRE